MKLLSMVLSLSICGVSGCQSKMAICGTTMVPLEPLVTLIDTKETKESPGRAYVVAAIPSPVFPYNLRMASIQGSAVVRLTIGKDGVVKNAIALQSSMKEFEEPSLVAAKQWRFLEVLEPGQTERTGAIVDCTIDFSFKKEEPNQALEPTAPSGRGSS